MRSRLRAAAVLAVLVLGCTGCEWMSWATPSVTGGALDASAGTRALTPDARYLVFASKATNATTNGPTNAKQNLYRRDLQTGTTARITHTTTGGDPNQGSTFESISADGRYVTFLTGATNMDASPRGGTFVRDMSSMSVTRPDPLAYAATLSSDGRYLSVTDQMGSSPDFTYALYRQDVATQARIQVDAGGGTPGGGSLNTDGTRMLYSNSTVASGGVVTTRWYVHDFTAGTDTAVTNMPTGVVRISGDLTKVLYTTGTTVPTEELYQRDLTTGTDTLVTQTADGQPPTFREDTDQPFPFLGVSMSSDGTHVAFWSAALNMAVGQTPQTAPNQLQVFVRDLTTGVTTEVDKTWNDQPVAPYVENGESFDLETALDGSGAYVAFDGLTSQFDPSLASTSLNVFVRAVAAPQPTAVGPSSLAPGSSTSVTVSGHGFATNAQLVVNTSAGNTTGVTISAVHVTSSTTLTATITLAPSVPVGAAVVGVLNPPPGPGLVPYSAGTCACATISP